MLNKTVKPANTNNDDDSYGSGDYVLLEAEEPEEVAESEEENNNNNGETAVNDNNELDRQPTTTSNGSVPEPTESMLEEASDLLLERFVDEPPEETEESIADANKSGDEISQLTAEFGAETLDEEQQPLLDRAFNEDQKQEDHVSVEEKYQASDDSRSDQDTKSDEMPENTPEVQDKREAENATTKEFKDVEKGNEGGEDDDEVAKVAKDDEEDSEGSKKNADPEDPKNDAVAKQDFRFGTRGEVNGAAAVFGVTALLVAGPVAGVIGAAASAHIAANKPCKCADLTRRCGGVVDNVASIGKKKRLERAAKKRADEGEGAAATTTTTTTTTPKPHLWDKITDRLVEGGEWTEKKLIPRRRRAGRKVVEAADE